MEVKGHLFPSFVWGEAHSVRLWKPLIWGILRPFEEHPPQPPVAPAEMCVSGDFTTFHSLS